MGLLDYYRQFAGMSEEEVTSELHRRAAEERGRALQRIDPLDLSRTTWHELPHPDVVAAVTFAARGGLNDAPDPLAIELRRELGRRHGLEPQRVLVGNGAANLLGALTGALLAPDDELLTPWPSYPLYPLLARRAGARAVPVAGGMDPERLLAAVNDSTRVLVLCNPNDPTGEHLEATRISALLDELPERVTVLLDEALADFVDAEPAGASLSLLDEHPRLIAVRTLSKAYGLAGLRCGWALTGPGAEPLVARLQPDVGVSTPQQAGALEALRKCGAQVAARRDQVVTERRRVIDALSGLPLDVSASEANLLWLRAPGLSGTELSARLARAGVFVHSGAEVGADDRVRVTIQSARASDRLLDALSRALG